MHRSPARIPQLDRNIVVSLDGAAVLGIADAISVDRSIGHDLRIAAGHRRGRCIVKLRA
jgi:hypothetical protein